MRNFWLVASHEYRRTVMKRAFLIITFAIPIGLAAVIALSILVFASGDDKSPVGYVDNSGTLDISLPPAQAETNGGVEIRAYPDEDAALAALEQREIQAFFVLPAEYPQSLHTDLVYLEEPPSNDAWGDFDDFVRSNLLASLPEDVRQRVSEGPAVTVVDVASNREFSEAAIINIILPFVATFFFFVATMMASGYMLQVVAEEKENKTMEVMLTSVTPGQLIGGKAVGLMAASLTQLAIYVVAAIVGLVIAAQYIPELQHAVVPWEYLGLMAMFFFPSYVLIAAVMIAIGSSVTELQQGQQIAGMLNFLFIAPIFLIAVILENPSNPIITFFTFFPTTSFLTISLRWGLGTVPMWQVAVSWVILVATAALMMWAASRVFRAGMLRYGQPLTFKSALAAVRRG
jgi:ABC-2 type transport system permease protein